MLWYCPVLQHSLLSLAMLQGMPSVNMCWQRHFVFGNNILCSGLEACTQFVVVLAWQPYHAATIML